MRVLLLCAALASAGPWGAGPWGSGPWGGGPWAKQEGLAAVSPIFDLNVDAFGSGPGQLSATLTSNGATWTPILDCDLRNVSGANLTCATGGTMAETGAGASPTSGLPAPYTESGARAASFANAKFYNLGADVTTGDIGATEDMAFEISWLTTGATNGYVGKSADNANPRAGMAGWAFSVGSTSAGVIISDGTNVAQSSSAAVAASTWNVMHVYLDHNENSGNGFQTYVNGAVVGAGVNPSAVGSLANAGSMRIGSGLTGTIAHVRAWKCAAGTCLTGGAGNRTVMDAVFKQRFAQLSGVYPTVAVTPTPATMTRASTSVVDIDRDGDGVRRLFTVGNGWMRVGRRNIGGTYRAGLLKDPSSTNVALQSQTLDNASWTTVNTTVTANSTVAPDGTTTADSIAQTAGAGNVAHCITQPPTLTAATHTASFFVRSSTRTIAYINDATIANGAAWFNMGTGLTGTRQAGVAASAIEAFDANWFRVSITFTGTAAAHTIQLCAASADNTTTYDGGAGTATQIIAWGTQVEARPFATAYIATTTATVTRAEDDPEYSPTNFVDTQGTIVATEVLPVSPANNLPGNVVDIAKDANNHIRIEPLSANLFFVYTTGAVDQFIVSTGTTVYDGTLRTYRVTFSSAPQWQAFKDGVQVGATDNAGTLWSGAAAIRLGIGLGGMVSTGGMLTRLRIYATPIPGTAGAP